MTTNLCVAAVRHAVAQLNARDFEGYAAAFAPGCLRRIPGSEHSLTVAEVIAGLELFASSLEGFHLDEVLLIGEGRHVCAHWRLGGVHIGDGLGVPATGRAVAFESAEFYEFEDDGGGLVTASWSFADTSSWFAQLESSS